CRRSDALGAAASYPGITLTVSVSATSATSGRNAATVSGGGEVVTTNDTANDVTAIGALPDLTITKTHAGSFTQGQTGATYTLTRSEERRVGNTTGARGVARQRNGRTATAIAGSGSGGACAM